MTSALGVDGAVGGAVHPLDRPVLRAAGDDQTAPGPFAARGRGLTRSRSLRHAVVQLACVAVLLGAVELAAVAAGPAPIWMNVLVTLTAAAFVGAGVLAWLRRPSSDIGAVLTAGGFVWLAADFGNATAPALIAIATITATVPLAVIVHLLVSFPSGRLTGRGARVLVVVAYLTCLVLQAPLYLFADAPAPYDTLQVAVRPDLASIGGWVQNVVGMAVMAVTAWLLVGRLRAATPPQRRVLAPLYAYSIAAVLLVPLSAIVVAPALGWSPTTLYAVQVAGIGLVPIAFVWSLLRGGFARSAELEELGAWLGVEERGHPALRRALAETLGDPTLQLVLWLPDRGYVDADGTAAATPVAGAHRGVSEIELAGARVGAITYDRASMDDPAHAATAGRVVAIAVDRERLTAELLANQEALRRSRQRIVEAGDRERRRIERNLHDGAQQRMMTVAMGLRLTEAHLSGADPAAGRLLADAASDLEGAMRELRELARGLHPPLLADAGLAGSLESLAERSAVPVHLSVRLAADLPQAAQIGAYYVVAEALTNAARHSGATRLEVRAATRDRLLRVEVVDDGVGGAAPAPGSGLEGLVDRVDALGGRLRITSPVGAGTALVAELPCG
ncbi:sensor histidine kinase [Pseudonocardia sichuanensis]